MPIPIAAIGAGVNILESIANPILQGVQNRKNRKWQEQQYARQRADSLSDWSMQNQYNSPEAQMQRYKNAGLNPNLIYGQSNDGATVRSSQTGNAEGEAPKLQTGQALLQAYYDLRMKDGQLANLELKNKIDEQRRQIEELKVQTQRYTNEGMVTANSRASLDFHQQEKLNPFSLQSAEYATTKAEAEARRSLTAAEIEAATKATTIQQAAQNYLMSLRQYAKTAAEIRNINQLSTNLQKEGFLKQSELDLRDQNIHPGDPGYWRVMAKIFSKIRGMIK